MNDNWMSWLSEGMNHLSILGLDGRGWQFEFESAIFHREFSSRKFLVKSSYFVRKEFGPTVIELATHFENHHGIRIHIHTQPICSHRLALLSPTRGTSCHQRVARPVTNEWHVLSPTSGTFCHQWVARPVSNERHVLSSTRGTPYLQQVAHFSWTYLIAPTQPPSGGVR